MSSEQHQNEPPPHIVIRALEMACESPCRSKRGVVIFRGADVITRGFNFKPKWFECDGSATCKADCRWKAVHAEQHALLAAGTKASGAEMLHVKAVNGVLVSSGGPSCVECSKLALAAGIAGVWLYDDGWRRYAIKEFHQLSLTSARGDKLTALRASLSELKPYVQHAPTCHLATDGNGEYTNCYRPLGPCDCGLAALLAALETPGRAAVSDQPKMPEPRQPLADADPMRDGNAAARQLADLQQRVASVIHSMKAKTGNQMSPLFRNQSVGKWIATLSGSQESKP